MVDATGAAQSEVNARFVPNESIGRLHQRGGCVGFDETVSLALRRRGDPAERVLSAAPKTPQPLLVDLSAIEQLCNYPAQSILVRKGEPHREHREHRDPSSPGDGENSIACRLIQDIEADHHHIPIVFHGSYQHRVAGVGVESFGDADEANLPSLSGAFHPRASDLDQAIVLIQRYRVEVTDVEVVGAECLEPLVHEPFDTLGIEIRVAADLGGEDDALSGNLSDRAIEGSKSGRMERMSPLSFNIETCVTIELRIESTASSLSLKTMYSSSFGPA